MNKYSLSALVAAGLLAGGLSSGSASAADLGGNCCADLEERIAELEATTARKGNRKVSLTVSGWVAEQVTYWDDGIEQNVYIGGIGVTLASHVKFTGQATIAPGWTAGYVLHLEASSAEPTAVNQDNDDINGGVSVLQSFWFIKSESLGKVSVGRQSHASDNAAILVDGSGSLVPANWVIFDGTSFFLNSGGARVNGTWGALGFCHHQGLGIGADCNGIPLEVIRYDSASFGGFSVSASWGEDDMWDVAARYAGEWNSIKVAAVAAYSHNTEGLRDSGYFQAGLYVQHVPSGLFAYGAYGREDNNQNAASNLVGGGTFLDIPLPQANLATLGSTAAPDGDHYYLKAGIRQRWTPLGHTVLYGEYAKHNDMFNSDALENNIQINFPPVPVLGITGCGFICVGLQQNVTDSELTRWGVGVVQEIDAAAMSLWLSYRHMEGEFSGVQQGYACLFGCAIGVAGPVTNFTTELDDIHIIKAGALINF